MTQQVRLAREERRSRLLDAARQLFGERGYRDTEVEAVARLAGVTKPILYRHFPGGKVEVFMAVIDEHVNRLMRVLWEAMAASNDPMERLYRGIDAYLAFAQEHPQGFRLMRAAAADRDLPAGGRLRDVREMIAKGLSNTIADVMRGAGLAAEGAPIYAYALLGAAESVVAWWLEPLETAGPGGSGGAAGPVGSVELGRPAAPSRAVVTNHLLAFAWRGFDGLPRDPSRLRHRRADLVLDLTGGPTRTEGTEGTQGTGRGEADEGAPASLPL
jgi:AcrR family transcriptional regulator